MEPVCKFDSPAKPVKKIDKKLLGVEFFDTNSWSGGPCQSESDQWVAAKRINQDFAISQIGVGLSLKFQTGFAIFESNMFNKSCQQFVSYLTLP